MPYLKSGHLAAFYLSILALNAPSIRPSIPASLMVKALPTAFPCENSARYSIFPSPPVIGEYVSFCNENPRPFMSFKTRVSTSLCTCLSVMTPLYFAAVFCPHSNWGLMRVTSLNSFLDAPSRLKAIGSDMKEASHTQREMSA